MTPRGNSPPSRPIFLTSRGSTKASRSALAAPLAAGVVGTILGVDEARHFAFNILKGREIPVPPVPGLSLQIDNFGRADPFLLGAKPADLLHPQPIQFGLKFDLLKAIPALRRAF